MRKQHSSDATAGLIGKLGPVDGPYIRSYVLSPSTVEICDVNSKIKVSLTGNRLRFIRKKQVRFKMKGKYKKEQYTLRIYIYTEACNSG